MLGRIIIGIGLLALTVAAVGLIILPGIVERGQNRMVPHEPYVISDDAQALHRTLTIADLHSDTLLWGRDPLKRSSYGHVDFPRLREGNVALQVFPAVTKSPAGQNYDSNTADTDTITALTVIQAWPPATWSSLTARGLHIADRLHRLEKRAPDQVKVIRTRRDLEALLTARADGKPLTGGLLAFEGAHILEGNLEAIDTLWEAGYRMGGLQHFFDNEVGGSLHGVSNAGLSDFGREALRAMVAKGYMIDVSHSSHAVVREVLSLTDEPLIVSHTGIRSACNSPRNIPDELMLRIAAGGGLIGIGYWAGAICDNSPEGVVRMLRAAIDLVGVDHVALGSDYDGAVEVTFDTSEIAVLTDRMLKAGFTEAEIRAVMGENQIRFFRDHLPE